MEATTKKKKFQFPDVYALIFILCCLAMVLTWIIPAGTFERVTEGTLTKVVAGTFQHVDSSPQTPRPPGQCCRLFIRALSTAQAPSS